MTQDFSTPVVVVETYPAVPAEPTSDSDTSTTDVAKEQAANVGSSAAGAGQHVAGVAKDQAAGVVNEASRQAKSLLGQTRDELQGQAAAQQDRITAGIRSLSTELGSLADGSEQSGTATDLIRQVSERAEDVATWLEARDPGALVQEVTDFAKRRPGAFLAIAVGAGLLAGRLTRGAVDVAREESDDSTSASSVTSAHVAPAAYPETYPTETYTTDAYPVEPVEIGVRS
jgi:hypothetical protein